MARGTKYKPSKSQAARVASNIQATKDMAKEVRKSKPTELKVKHNKYKNNTPKRPSIPKLPKLKLPGGGMTNTRIAKPSGRPGMIKDYTPVSDYSNTYKNRTPRRPK